MSDYWDIVQFQKRPGQEKAFMQRLGSAKKRDDGGFELYLNALPLPDGGQCKLTILPPRERGEAYRGNKATPLRTGTRIGDDDIPF